MNDIIKYTGSTEVTERALRIDELTDFFISSQDVKDSSKRLYRRTIEQYFNWIRDHRLQLDSLTRADILKYKEYLLSSGMSSLSVGSYITVVKIFYQWAEGNKLYPNIAKDVRTPKREKKFERKPLSDIQAQALLEYYRDKQAEALRDYAVVTLILRTGLRTIEVIRANVEDIVFEGGNRILYLQGKGKYDRNNFVILSEKAYSPIEAYLKTRGALKSKEPLFTSASNNNMGGRLTTRAISRLAKEGLKAIGIDDRRYTAHSLRHTTACSLIRAGASLEDVQGVLRHSNPATTQIYLSSIAEETRLRRNTEALLDRAF